MYDEWELRDRHRPFYPQSLHSVSTIESGEKMFYDLKIHGIFWNSAENGCQQWWSGLMRGVHFRLPHREFDRAIFYGFKALLWSA